MTERRALRYRNILIDTEKAINELLNLYNNDETSDYEISFYFTIIYLRLE